MSDVPKRSATPRGPSQRELRWASTRIEWARSLTNEQMEALLQEALLKARAATPREYTVTLLEEIVHELKSRLDRYNEIMGGLPPKGEGD